jgi:uncharacterized cupredoxin-like copper-binding protein
MRQFKVAVALLAAAVLVSGHVSAHGVEEHLRRDVDVENAEQKPFGRAAARTAATRTMTISMRDTMRFEPAVLTINRGETVRIVVRNDGKLMHELVLGTTEELKTHAELMRQYPDMELDEPHMVHVKPGGAEELVWAFNRSGEFQFACLIPGHFESGMTGRVIVK